MRQLDKTSSDFLELYIEQIIKMQMHLLLKSGFYSHQLLESKSDPHKLILQIQLLDQCHSTEVEL